MRCEMVLVCVEFEVDRSRDAVWDELTDTNTLNLRSGLAPIKMQPIDGRSSARYRVSTKLSGFSVVYDEEPYEWVRPQFFKVTRRIVRGSPARVIQMQFVLTEGGHGSTRVALRCMIIPRYWAMAPVIRDLTWMSLRKIRAAVMRPKAAMPVRMSASMSVWPRVQGALLRDDPIEAATLRPRVLAARWNMPTWEVVSAFLKATEEGTAHVRTEAACPSCRLPVGSGDGSGKHRCHMCDLSIIGTPATTMDVLFSPSPHKRQLPPAVVYCPGGPAKTPHIADQVIVPPGGLAEMLVPYDNTARYQLTIRGGAVADVTMLPSCASTVHVWFRKMPQSILMGQGGRLVLHNDMVERFEVHVRLEDINTTTTVLTLADIDKMRQTHPLSFAGVDGVLQAIRQQLG